VGKLTFGALSGFGSHRLPRFTSGKEGALERVEYGAIPVECDEAGPIGCQELILEPGCQAFEVGHRGRA